MLLTGIQTVTLPDSRIKNETFSRWARIKKKAPVRHPGLEMTMLKRIAN
jgi:hypothetical protein